MPAYRICLLVGLLAIADAAAQEGNPADLYESARLRYERHASKVTVFEIGSFLFGRPFDWRYPDLRGLPESAIEASEAARHDIEDRSAALDPIVRLTQHENPKVRTLAACALFAREEASLLPHIASLVADEAESFAMPGLSSVLSAEMPPPETRSVGWFASMLVEFWTTVVNSSANRFAEYWEPRKGRAHLASSFVVRLRRASWGTLPLRADRIEPIKAVRRALDALPAPDRDWILLWVSERCWFYERNDAIKHLAPTADLVAAGRRLGAEKLMSALAGTAACDDPDVNGRPGEPILRNVVLRNAGELLRAEDADVLLARELTDPDGPSPLWVIAAAAVRPDRAQALLEDAFARFTPRGNWDRAEIAAGLWRILGESQIDDLVEWFYSETPKAEARSTSMQSFFLRAIPGVRAPADRKLVARIVRDPRLAELDEAALRNVMLVVHRWMPVPDRLLRNSGRERAALLETLRASIPKWETP